MLQESNKFQDKKATPERDENLGKKQISEQFNSYAGIGINHLYCYYTLKEDNNLNWDYLQTIIDEGHKRGIMIHPIFMPGHEINLYPRLQKRLRERGIKGSLWEELSKR